MKAGKTDFECGAKIRITKSSDPDLIGAVGEITHPFPGMMASGMKYIAGLRDIEPRGVYSEDKCNLTSSDAFVLVEKDLLRSKVDEAIDAIVSVKKSEDGYYHEACYVDYSDSLSEYQIKEICSDDDPMEKFYDVLEDFARETIWDAEDYLRNQVMERLSRMDMDGIEYDEYSVRDHVQELVCFDFPYDEFLKTEIEMCVNVVLDTGDGNYDFVSNDMYPHYNGDSEEPIPEEASVLWLAQAQGYFKVQLEAAMKDCEFGDSKFLKSLRTEVLNCTTHMNALTFLVKMDLGMWMNLNDGVAIPFKCLDSILPDGERGYSIMNCYGMNEKPWKKNGLVSVQAMTEEEVALASAKSPLNRLIQSAEAQKSASQPDVGQQSIDNER